MSHDTAKIPPSISLSSLNFLENLASYYRDSPYVNSDESSDEEVSAYEMKRLQAIERNKNEIKRLGLDKASRSLNANFLPLDTRANTEEPKESCPKEKLSAGGKKGAETYRYTVTPSDLQREQQAFQAGEGKKELVEGLGVYIKYIELEQCEQCSKNSPTGLMRALIGIWYSRERLAACSANQGINETIKIAIFKYCELKYASVSIDKLKRDLTSKCGEERRRLKKDRSAAE